MGCDGPLESITTKGHKTYGRKVGSTNRSVLNRIGRFSIPKKGSYTFRYTLEKNKNLIAPAALRFLGGGSGGIRTHGTR